MNWKRWGIREKRKEGNINKLYNELVFLFQEPIFVPEPVISLAVEPKNKVSWNNDTTAKFTSVRGSAFTV